MASTYLRPDSNFIWIRFKDPSGKWKSTNSGYRKDSTKDRRQAKLLAQEKSLEEATVRVTVPGRSGFDQWATQWLDQRHAHKNGLTLRRYRRCLFVWLRYLQSINITSPAMVTREIALNFVSERERQGVSRNGALYEIRFAGMLMDEAVRRDYCRNNPVRRLGLSSTPQQHKEVWSPDQIQLALSEAEKLDKYGFIHVSLSMGRWQACRLASCEVPLAAIDLERRIIVYPGNVIKGGEPFTQAIDPGFLPILSEIIAHRRSISATTLATLPKNPSASLELRRFLDGIGLHGLSHHGLRVSWCTNAALGGVPMAAAMRFTNHASADVHRAYEQISAGDVVQFFDRLKK